VLASGLALTAAWLLPTRRAPEADGALAAVQARVAGIPPPQSGYFHLRGAGTWSSLPGGRACAAKVHRSNWEPRPLNHVPNAVIPGRVKVRAAFAARPRAVGGSYAARWDTWLLPRVSGAYAGKTDEIFQWAACKWGLPDNLLRAIAVRESTWYQYPTYRSGACVVDWGCGDIFGAASGASSLYCDGIAKIGGYDYQADFAAGICPKTKLDRVRGRLPRFGSPRVHRGMGAMARGGDRLQTAEREAADVGMRRRVVRGRLALGCGRRLHRPRPACVAQPRVAHAHVRGHPAPVRECRRMRERVI
jgi:hypothetical protein